MDEFITNRGWQAGRRQQFNDRGDRAEQALPQDRSADAPQHNRPPTKQRQALRRKLQEFGRRRKKAHQAAQTAQASKTDQTPVDTSLPDWNHPRRPARAQPPAWVSALQMDNTRNPSRKPRPSIATGLVISVIAVSVLFALGFEGSRLISSYMEINAVESALEAAKSPKQATASAPVPSRTKLAELSPAEAGPRTIVAAPSVPASLFDAPKTTAPLPSVSPPAVAAIVPDAATESSLSVAPPAVAAIVPDAATEPSLVEATRLMAEGHKILATGDVLGARNLFAKSLQLGLPEAALALGRAHDPEYLALIPNANASPSVDVAGAMYRQWYRKSVAAGSIAEGVQLDRLLHSMDPQ